MAAKRSLQDKDLLIPLGVLGVLAGIDVALPPEMLVSGSDHAAEEIDDDMALVLAERHTRRVAA